MKILIFSLSFIFLFCKDSTTENKISECKKIYIGGNEICLPLLKGMKECYDEEEIKARVDPFKVPGNTIHAYYVSDTFYNTVINSTDYLLTSDCIKVFSVNKSHNLVVTN